MTTSTLSSITLSWFPTVWKDLHCLGVAKVHISYTPETNCRWAKDRFNNSFEKDICVKNATRSIPLNSSLYQSVYTIDELDQNVSYVIELQIISPHCNETTLRGDGLFKTLQLGMLFL